MNPNDNQNNKRNKNGGNWRGPASLVAWALVLTIVVKYLSLILKLTFEKQDYLVESIEKFQK